MIQDYHFVALLLRKFVISANAAQSHTPVSALSLSISYERSIIAKAPRVCFVLADGRSVLSNV